MSINLADLNYFATGIRDAGYNEIESVSCRFYLWEGQVWVIYSGYEAYPLLAFPLCIETNLENGAKTYYPNQFNSPDEAFQALVNYPQCQQYRELQKN